MKAKYDVLNHLKKVSALLSVNDALLMLDELKNSLTSTLQHPKLYVNEVSRTAEALTAISFDESKIIGNATHIKPLYIKGKAAGRDLSHILVDCGSVVNIMSQSTLLKLGFVPE